MPSAFDPFQVVDIPSRTGRISLQTGDLVVVVRIELERCGLDHLIEMPRVASTDNDARHASLIEHPTNGDRTDTHAAASRDRVQPSEQRLKSLPTPELLDDQPVLHQRSILERRVGFRCTQIPVREKPAGKSAITQKADAAFSAKFRHASCRSTIQHRELDLVRNDRDAGGDDLS